MFLITIIFLIFFFYFNQSIL